VDGVLLAVLGAEINGAHRFDRGSAVRPGSAGAEAGCQIEHEQRLAQIGIAVDDGHLAEGETARHEPGNRPRRQLTDGENLQIVCDEVLGHGSGSFADRAIDLFTFTENQIALLVGWTFLSVPVGQECPTYEHCLSEDQ